MKKIKIKERIKGAIYGWINGNLLFKDFLTGCFNRQLLKQFWIKEIARAERHNYLLSIVLLDVDGLKKINDSLGHNEGDKILKKIVMIITHHLRTSDILFRFGGDEFLLILPETTIIQARTILIRSQRMLIKAKFSFGVAQWKKGELLKNLIEQADKDLYKMKISRKPLISND